MLLTVQDHGRIEAAVRLAEAKTRGQIVCVIAEEASHYLEVPLAWGAVGALILPIVPLLLGGAAAWLDEGLRGWSAAHVAATHATVIAVLAGYALAQCLTFLAIVTIVSIPPVRRGMTPRALRRGHVHSRAVEQFYARGLHTTRERTGVLLYVSLKDRMAEVLADVGIDAKVAPGAWNDAIERLQAGIKAHRPVDGFIAAIEACGQLLALHAPADGLPANELPDAVVEAPPV